MTSSAGSFVDGFQRGALIREHLTDRGQERQEKGRMAEERQGLSNDTAIQLGGESMGELPDPYEWSLGNVFKEFYGRMRGNQAIDAGAMQSRDAGMSENPMQGVQTDQNTGYMKPVGYADGGEIERRNQANRAAWERKNQARGMSPKQIAERDFLEKSRPRRALDTVMGRNPGSGGAARVGRAVRTGVRRAVPLSMAVSAHETYNTPTEDYRTRFGMEPDEDPSLMGDIGVRALGAISDMGNTMTFGQAGRFYRDKQGKPAPVSGQKRAAPDQEAAVEEQVVADPPPVNAGKGSARGSALPTQGGGQFVGPTQPEMAGAEIGNIDIMPDEMPSMSVGDWQEYRAKTVPRLIRMGASLDEADAQVTRMQHAGFQRYAGQAASMLAANNLKGAARSLKAAYQYFPNGVDVKFGFQNGHLVALGMNEETGEPTGKPQVVTQEYIAAVRMNLDTPEKYVAWTKDLRDEAFREREYKEVTKHSAQGDLDYQNRMATVAERNADTSEMRAIAYGMGQGDGGGMTNTEFAASEKVFRERLELMGAMGDELARDASQLTSIMSQLRARLPRQQFPDNKITDDILLAYENGNMDAVLELLMSSGTQ